MRRIGGADCYSVGGRVWPRTSPVFGFTRCTNLHARQVTHKFVRWMKSWTTPNTRNRLTARNKLLQTHPAPPSARWSDSQTQQSICAPPYREMAPQISSRIFPDEQVLRRNLRTVRKRELSCRHRSKTLIAKNTQLAPRSLNHIAGQCSETLQSTWLDREFDMPRNLPVHTHRPVYLPPLWQPNRVSEVLECGVGLGGRNGLQGD